MKFRTKIHRKMATLCRKPRRSDLEVGNFRPESEILAPSFWDREPQVDSSNLTTELLLWDRCCYCDFIIIILLI